MGSCLSTSNSNDFPASDSGPFLDGGKVADDILEFNKIYKTGDELGVGGFAVVKEGFHRQTGESFAIKIVTKARLSPEDARALQDEIRALQDLKHSNIIRLYAVFEEHDYHYLVTERMHGGELFERIVQKSYYNERESRDTCKILFGALAYCHQRKVAHRDLKPENLLLASKDSDSYIKLADFGFAKRCEAPNSLRTQCGTPQYVAPEILKGQSYDTRADLWSLGVIVYILLGGYPPFVARTQRELFHKIRRGDYKFHAEYWGLVGDDAKNMIKSLLTVDPTKRVSAQAALRSPWMTEDGDILEDHDLSPSLIRIQAFNGKRKLKSCVKAVIAARKFESLGVLPEFSGRSDSDSGYSG